VDFGLQIVPSACPCHSESKKLPEDWICRRTVIEKQDKKGSRQEFNTRTLTANKDKLNEWNLGVFAQPRHPSMKTVQTMRSEFLSIDFASVAHRVEFRGKFTRALQKRDEAEADYQGIIRDTRYLNERNGNPPSPPLPRGPSRSDSIRSLSRLPDRPPVIRPLSPFSTFRMNDYASANDGTSNDVNGGVNGASGSSASDNRDIK
jgi:hypothetical protein